jgi:hypothetical protein
MGTRGNEHFCLSLARELGMPVADSRAERFEKEVAIVVERYDRVRGAKGSSPERGSLQSGAKGPGTVSRTCRHLTRRSISSEAPWPGSEPPSPPSMKVASAVSIGLVGLLACSSTPKNYGDLCDAGSDCTGGLDCVTTSCGGGQFDSRQCSKLCPSPGFHGCPPADTNDPRILVVCESDGLACDGGTILFCKEQVE